MKNSTHLPVYLAQSIIQDCISFDFSRANFRAQSGDIVLEITSDLNNKLVMHFDSQDINCNNPKMNEAVITIQDSDFEMLPGERNKLKLSNHLLSHFTHYCERCVWGPSKTYEYDRS